MSRRQTLAGLAVALIAMSIIAGGATATPAPRTTQAVSAARSVVATYFRALGAHRFERACSLLGRGLLAETGGVDCPTLLKIGMPKPLVWRIVRTTREPEGVGIVLRLGQNELDRLRMRVWLVLVTHEPGGLRITETRLVR